MKVIQTTDDVRVINMSQEERVAQFGECIDEFNKRCMELGFVRCSEIKFMCFDKDEQNTFSVTVSVAQDKKELGEIVERESSHDKESVA